MSKIINFPITNISEGEDMIKIERSEEFYISTRMISEFICNLPLSAADNDRLIALLVEQLQEAENTAFLQGFGMGCEMAKALNNALNN
ncbi:hypothetical protein [Pelosinus sp. IPA-1]|uniref:hypothetical protein n=1 Tax=Pelosinus sp. IPA-1 TaxID=3029569 RepID=UPI002436237E|nr:hypothetical protein [Pelosinus sp. IPA-1]GMB01858.1 hypothetical protein PIPA1_46580 [Pelosinus sp. IPA-1]